MHKSTATYLNRVIITCNRLIANAYIFVYELNSRTCILWTTCSWCRCNYSISVKELNTYELPLWWPDLDRLIVQITLALFVVPHAFNHTCSFRISPFPTASAYANRTFRGCLYQLLSWCLWTIWDKKACFQRNRNSIFTHDATEVANTSGWLSTESSCRSPKARCWN